MSGSMRKYSEIMPHSTVSSSAGMRAIGQVAGDPFFAARRSKRCTSQRALGCGAAMAIRPGCCVARATLQDAQSQCGEHDQNFIHLAPHGPAGQCTWKGTGHFELMLEGSGPRGRNLSPQRDSLIAPHRHRPSWPPGVVTSRADMLRTRPEVSPEVSSNCRNYPWRFKWH